MQLENSTIELSANNPYSLGQIFIFPEGDYLLDGSNAEIAPSTEDRYYTITESDDLWNISMQAYSDSKWYWGIAKYNGIFNAADLPIGETILIPPLYKLKALVPDGV